MLLVAGTSGYDFLRLDLAQTLETQSYDWRLERSKPDNTRREDIVIVDIDENSLNKIQQWPWSRDKFAALTDQLFRNYRAKTAAYTLPFANASNASKAVLRDAEDWLYARLGDNLIGKSNLWTRGVREAIGWVGELQTQFDYDNEFAQSIGKFPVVFGYRFLDASTSLGALPHPARFIVDGVNLSSSQVLSYTKQWTHKRGRAGVYEPLLAAADNTAGYTDFPLDYDGAVRRARLFTRHAGEAYASLPVMLLRSTQGHGAQSQIEMQSGSGDHFNTARVGGYTFRLNTRGEVYTRYLNSGGRTLDFSTSREAVFRYLSAADVIQGRVRGEHLRDKIVLVGSSVLQEELYATPVNPAMPQVEIIATQLANFLDENVLHRPDNALLFETLALLAGAGLLAALFAFIGPFLSGVVLFGVFAGTIYYVLDRWNVHHEVWSLTPPLIVTSGLYVVNAITGFFETWQSSRHLQSTFEQYLPPEVAKQVGAKGSVINLEGEEKELTILFSDVRNFTSISEYLSPRDLTRLMNRMLTALSEEIHRCHGTIDKYIGDAVMAFWNAPLNDPKHARNAIAAAFGMQKAILAISNDLSAKGFDDEIRLGIGIATGNANVGNMGSTSRMAYTAIGDTVNLSSRVEGMTKFYQCPILVSEHTRAQCKNDFLFRSVDLVQVKGRTQPVTMFEPIAPSRLVTSADTARVEKFEAIRTAYTRGAFAEAQALLTKYRSGNAHDALAVVYEDRIAHLIAHPPANWNGVMTHSEK